MRLELIDLLFCYHLLWAERTLNMKGSRLPTDQLDSVCELLPIKLSGKLLLSLYPPMFRPGCVHVFKTQTLKFLAQCSFSD